MSQNSSASSSLENFESSAQQLFQNSQQKQMPLNPQLDLYLKYQPKIQTILESNPNYFDINIMEDEALLYSQIIYQSIKKSLKLRQNSMSPLDQHLTTFIQGGQKGVKSYLDTIRKELVFCRNQDICCQFQGKMSDYKKHLKECLYEFSEYNGQMVMNIAQKKMKDKNYVKTTSSSYQPQNSNNNNDQDPSSQNFREERTLLVANFPKIGMVELFKKFGELDYFSFQKNDKNLIFFAKFSKLENAQRSLDQLDQTEILGRKLRVTFFRPKQDLQKFRVFVKGLQTNSPDEIKQFLEDLLKKQLSQVSLLNQYSYQRDASAFVQVFDEEDADFLKKQGVISNSQIGKKVQFCEYRSKGNGGMGNRNDNSSRSPSLSSSNLNGNSSSSSSNNGFQNGYQQPKIGSQNTFNKGKHSHNHHHHNGNHHHHHNHNNNNHHHNNNHHNIRNNSHSYSNNHGNNRFSQNHHHNNNNNGRNFGGFENQNNNGNNGNNNGGMNPVFYNQIQQQQQQQQQFKSNNNQFSNNNNNNNFMPQYPNNNNNNNNNVNNPGYNSFLDPNKNNNQNSQQQQQQQQPQQQQPNNNNNNENDEDGIFNAFASDNYAYNRPSNNSSGGMVQKSFSENQDFSNDFSKLSLNNKVQSDQNSNMSKFGFAFGNNNNISDNGFQANQEEENKTAQILDSFQQMINNNSNSGNSGNGWSQQEGYKTFQ